MAPLAERYECQSENVLEKHLSLERVANKELAYFELLLGIHLHINIYPSTCQASKSYFLRNENSLIAKVNIWYPCQ